jgi:hypothetical protein
VEDARPGLFHHLPDARRHLIELLAQAFQHQLLQSVSDKFAKKATRRCGSPRTSAIGPQALIIPGRECGPDDNHGPLRGQSTELVSKLLISGELLRGSLLERTVRHTKDCPKCARGEGHQVFVLTVTYPGGARASSVCAASALPLQLTAVCTRRSQALLPAQILARSKPQAWCS